MPTPVEITINDVLLALARAAAGQKAVLASGNHTQLTNPTNLEGTPSIQLVAAVLPKVSGVFRVMCSGSWSTANETDVTTMQIYYDLAPIAGSPVIQIHSVAASAAGSMQWLVTVPMDGDSHEISFHLQNADNAEIFCNQFNLAIVCEELAA